MSQNDMILDYLKKGNKITSLDALSMFRCFRLASRISDLKHEGHNINTKFVSDNGKKYSVYWIGDSNGQRSFV